MAQVFVTYLFSFQDLENPSVTAVWTGLLENTEDSAICEIISQQRPAQKNITLLAVEVTEVVSSSNLISRREL